MTAKHKPRIKLFRKSTEELSQQRNKQKILARKHTVSTVLRSFQNTAEVLLENTFYLLSSRMSARGTTEWIRVPHECLTCLVRSATGVWPPYWMR